MRLLFFISFLAFIGTATACCNNNIASHAMRTNFNPLLEKCPSHALFSCEARDLSKSVYTTVILNGKVTTKIGNQHVTLLCRKSDWKWTYYGTPVKSIECRR